MSKIFSLFSVLISLYVLVGAVRKDSPWTVNLIVSDVAGSEYEGVVEILVIFKDQSEHSTVLPSTKYQTGQTYSFDVSLTSAGPIQAVYLRTKGFCPLGLLPADLLRLSRVEMISKSTNDVYTKQVDDLAIKDACQTVGRGTTLTDFAESNTKFCTIDGQKYESGERFDMGCEARCMCANGTIECTDMCAPQAWEPEQKCHFVRMPGECCDKVVCEEEEKVKTCQEARPINVRKPGKKPAPPVRRYPWSVLYCTDVNCTQIHGGVIVGERHILTYAPDMTGLPSLQISAGQYIVDQQNSSDFARLAISNVTTHSDFINPNSPVADSASRLQIVELDKQFSFSKEKQAANVPFNADHCKSLSKNDCPIMTVGWDRTDDTDNEIRQWFLHADKSKRDESLCRSNSTDQSHRPKIVPRRRGEKRVCVGDLVRQDCTGPMGGAVVANAADIDFVVGIVDPDSALFFCDHPGTADVLPLCKYVDWINESTNQS